MTIIRILICYQQKLALPAQCLLATLTLARFLKEEANFIAKLMHAGQTNQPDTRSARQGINRIEFRLSLARASFFYQASRLWSALPDEIRSTENKAMFKKKSKAWVKKHIVIKP